MSDSTLYVRKSSGLTRTVSANQALFANLVGMGILVNIFWITYASAGYPGADLTATVFTAAGVNLVVAYVYWMLSVSMPRTGGDYVWVGRIIHPSIAFMENLVLVVIIITWVGLFPYLAASTKLPMLFENLAITTGNQSYGRNRYCAEQYSELHLHSWCRDRNRRHIDDVSLSQKHI